MSIKKVVIAGGGTAGWIAAAALTKFLGDLIEITLIESQSIGTVGVGEATIPPLRVFHHALGIDEKEFMRETSATIKLGIQFDNWKDGSDRYFHAFGKVGKSTWMCEFVHFWRHAQTRGLADRYGDYSLELPAAESMKFSNDPEAGLSYAYHLDSSQYARYLKKFSLARGLKWREGKISSAVQNPDSGFISGIRLENGEVIEGDLFIDCTGFRSLLIEQTLHTGFEAWQDWLFCNSAVTVQTDNVGDPVPYTRSIARDWGWQWQIPLQHRTGNGMVFCDQYISDEKATEMLLANISGRVLNEPRVIKYKTGRRKMAWNKNCVALGLSSGFVEPLESTSIYLFMIGITRLIQYFPFNGIEQSLIDHYNQQAKYELEAIRDFVVLHYHLTERRDSEFWRRCATMEIPDSLAHKLDLFKKESHVHVKSEDLFRVDSWIQVMLGQGIWPQSYHQVAGAMKDQDLLRFMKSIKMKNIEIVKRLPTHQQFLTDYCLKQN